MDHVRGDDAFDGRQRGRTQDPGGGDDRGALPDGREPDGGVGHLFEVHGDEAAVRFARDVRLCFAWEDEPVLVEGVERLARVVRRLVDQGEAAWYHPDVDGDGGADVGGMK